MTLARTIPALLVGALLAIPAAAQYDDPIGDDPEPAEGCAGAPNKVQIAGSSLSFAPSTITIDAGQAVCWTWNASMSHNVRADDGSFGSGQPTTAGNFQRTFTAPGTYGYHCQVHGSATAGMRGTVVVRDTGGGGGDDEETGPGTLSLEPGAYEVDENAGSVTVTIVRTGGTDGKVTVKVATGTGSARKGKDFTARRMTAMFLDGDRGPKTVTIPIKNDRTIEPDEFFAVTLSKATGRATLGNSSATVTIHDDDGAEQSAALLAPFGVEAAGVSGREIRLAWAADAPGVEAVRIERRSGDGDFREIAVVPAGAGEHVDAGLPSGTSFHYRLRAEGAEELSEYSEIVAAATDGAIGPCAAGASTLCLAGRFEAKADFRAAEGEPLRPAQRLEVPGTSRTGLLAFGSAGDPQMMLEVVDGCADNDHFWVELAALTDLEVEVSVRDTRTGRTWVFYNPAGKAAGVVRDLDAFGTCP